MRTVNDVPEFSRLLVVEQFCWKGKFKMAYQVKFHSSFYWGRNIANEHCAKQVALEIVHRIIMDKSNENFFSFCVTS